MRIFLENSLTSKVNYVNTFPYLKEYFQQYLIPIKNDSCISLQKEHLQYPFERKIEVVNGIQDGNLRIIETHLPEILFMFATNCEGDQSIYSLIEKISKAKFFHDSAYYTEIFLSNKMIDLFEMLLFRDRAKEIWNGEYDPYVCYVLKGKEELEYYFLYDSKKLIRLLLNFITIKLERNNEDFSSIKFELIKEI